MTCKYCGKFLMNHKCIYCGTFSEKSLIPAEDLCEVKDYEGRTQVELVSDSPVIGELPYKTSKETFKAWKRQNSAVTLIFYGINALCMIIMLFDLYLIWGNGGIVRIPSQLKVDFRLFFSLGHTQMEKLFYTVLLALLFFEMPVAYILAAGSFWYIAEFSKWIDKEKIDYRSIIKKEQVTFLSFRFVRLLKYAGLFKDDEVCKKVVYARIAYCVICAILTTIQAGLFVSGIMNAVTFLSITLAEDLILLPSNVFLMVKVKSNLWNDIEKT